MENERKSRAAGNGNPGHPVRSENEHRNAAEVCGNADYKAWLILAKKKQDVFEKALAEKQPLREDDYPLL
jgi:hypothetical protein